MPRFLTDVRTLCLLGVFVASQSPVSAQDAPAAAPKAPVAAPAPAASSDKPVEPTLVPDAAPKTESGSAAPMPTVSPAGTVVATPPAPAPHPAVFRYYDKDGDGTLSQAEFDQLPEPIREWLTKEKVSAEQGIPREAFEAKLPALTDALRKRTAATVLGPTPLPMPGSTPAPSGNSRGQGSSEFQGLDLDRDGQLSFREWRAGKRLAADFGVRDPNGDGMVTSAEFDKTRGQTAATAPAVAGTRPPGTPGAPQAPPSAPGTSTPMPTPGAPAAPAATSTTSGLGTTASRSMFGSLDRNKNGSVDPDEWQYSRRVGPAFKEKGVDMTKPMSEALFHENYAKAFPPSSRS